MNDEAEFHALAVFSAAIGADPARVQGAGGNTSLKRDGAMRIKASGTWLADAEKRPIFAAVGLAPLLAALAAGDPAVERAGAFVDATLNPPALRPSIETCLHALIAAPVVAHVHCVDTIALAVRRDAEARIGERLAGLGDVVWAHVPYARPGLPLAQALAHVLKPGLNVATLANHGLVVAGASVAEVEARLGRVCAALAAARQPAPPPDLVRLARIVEGSPYRLPAEEEAHAVATVPENLAFARQGTLYPDHIVFLGSGIVEAEAPPPDTGPPMLVIPGLGVVLRKDCTPGADAMARCLAEVVARIPAGAEIAPLRPEDEYALTHWEAERFRQTLGAARAAP